MSGHMQCKKAVRFTPKSRHVRCTSACPLWAISGHTARSSGVGISLLQNACRSGRIHSVIVPANPDTAWSPRSRYPTPAVVTVSGGEDWSSDEEEPVVATYEEMV